MSNAKLKENEQGYDRETSVNEWVEDLTSGMKFKGDPSKLNNPDEYLI
jgi:hypothetical protein